MLEWYHAFAGLELIEKDLESLLQELAESSLVKGSLGSLQKKSIAELFKSHLGLTLTPATRHEELMAWCAQLELEFDTSYTWNELFHLIFVGRIESCLDSSEPLIIYDFPPSQCALARLNSEGWADRFELYWRGFEIANAFHELNDSQEQRRRYDQEAQVRKEKELEKIEVDEKFLRALELGMPPSGGIAVGLERLFLAAQKETELKRVRSFSAQEFLRDLSEN